MMVLERGGPILSFHPPYKLCVVLLLLLLLTWTDPRPWVPFDWWVLPLPTWQLSPLPYPTQSVGTITTITTTTTTTIIIMTITMN